MPQGGCFERVGPRGRVLADVNHAVLFNRGDAYETEHPCGGGDHGLALVLPLDVALDIVARFDPGAEDRDEKPFDATHGVLGPKELPVQAALMAELASETACTLKLDELILELAASAVESAYVRLGSMPRRLPTRLSHRRQVEAVKAILARRLGDGLGLAEIASAVGASPYHLSRVFKAFTGMAIHTYRTQLRLREAMGRLADGADDLTQLALELGFASHAHLTSTFSTGVGMPPSVYRQRLGRLC